MVRCALHDPLRGGKLPMMVITIADCIFLQICFDKTQHNTKSVTIGVIKLSKTILAAVSVEIMLAKQQR